MDVRHSDSNIDGCRPKKMIKLMSNNEISKSFISSNDVKSPNSVYSSNAMKMMEKMGYRAGKGLGITEQGITAPIEVSKQKGRRGMGTTLKGFEASTEEWDYDLEEICVPEKVSWLDRKSEMSEKDLVVEVGPEKLEIDDETLFISEETLGGILSSKSVFDELEGKEMMDARSRSNPFEVIKSGIFLNRAAMKMANMDSLLDFMFTSHKNAQGLPSISANELLYFADICAGPGGFTEYVLWRKKRHAKGFGFTLRGENDFKLENFTCADKEYFEPHYGVGGINGDGDIFKTENILEFQKFVLQNTFNQGVHFVMADGGFSVDGQENIQEILSKRLYLCQFLTALLILRPGGHFVCKLFDIFTTFSLTLIYILRFCFSSISIIKPVTSRPANSERYIVCKSKMASNMAANMADKMAANMADKMADNMADNMADVDFIVRHLLAANQTLDKLEKGETVLGLCPLERVLSDEEFCAYIRESNEQIGKQQIISLAKLKHFAQNVSLSDPRQLDLRTKCLQLWDVPDCPRQSANERREPPHIVFQCLTRETRYECQKEWLQPGMLDNIKSIFDYRCIVMTTEKQYLLLGMGSNHVYKYEYCLPTTKWLKVDEVNIQLPRNTLLDVEFVEEFRGEGRGQIKINCVHVFDALFLGGDDIRSESYEDRLEKTKCFVRAITRTSRHDLCLIRVKDIYNLENINDLFNSLKMRQGKSVSQTRRPTLDIGEVCPLGKPRYIVPHSLYLPRLLRDPWMLAYSRSQRRQYFYHTLERRSQFEPPAGAYGGYRDMVSRRVFWGIGALRLSEEQPVPEKVTVDQLTKQDVLDFVASKL